MKTRTFLAAVIAIISLSAFTVSESISWNISDDFSVKILTEHAEGAFTELSGDIVFDPADLSSASFNMSIPVSSINTGNGMKNKHAVGKKWFQADQFPNITFKSESFNKTASGYEVVGTLKMHGVALEHTMPFTFENNVFNSKFSVSRVDYKIGALKGMSAKVPHDIALDITVPVSK